MGFLAERAFRIYWGASLQNALDLASSSDGRGVGTLPTLYRTPRESSTQLVNQGTNVAWVNAKRFYLKFSAKFVTAPNAFGATGIDAFLDWASDGGTFTLVPNLSVPALTIPGCRLEGSFVTPNWGVGQGEVYSLELVVWHPTIDLGVAWRGLFFEYAAGGSLTDPIFANYARSTVGNEIGPAGRLVQHAVNSPCDGHYPWGIGGTGVQAGIQTTLLEGAVTNDVTNPVDLTQASWGKTDVTVAGAAAMDPMGAVTACLVSEDTAVSVNHNLLSNTWAVTAADPVHVVAYVRNGGHARARLYICDAANTSRVGVDFNLVAQTLTPHLAGSGVLISSSIVPMAGGWFQITWRGTVDATSTSFRFIMTLMDVSGNTLYTGDGASGIFLWGVTAVHGTQNAVASFTATTSGADSLVLPWPQTGLGATTQQSFWFYAQWVELGVAFQIGFQRIFRLGYGNGGGAQGLVVHVFGNKGNTGNNRYGFEAWANGTQMFQIDDWPTTTVNLGDVFEAFGTIVWDAATNHWTASLQVAQNGAVVSTLGPAAGSALPQAFWTSPATYLGAQAGGSAPDNSNGVLGLAVLRVGPYVPSGPFSVQSLLTARNT